MSPERCFACGRKLVRPSTVFTEDQLADGRQYEVHVGPECASKVKASAAAGYQPPAGGPRLYARQEDALDARERCVDSSLEKLARPGADAVGGGPV